MPESSTDVAVFGASPFALLLAGLLRSTHGKRVCLVGDPWSAYRLPRGFDISVTPVTRPETWVLLKRAAAETTKLLRTIGRGLYERVDPLFVADTEAGADYLGQMRWVAEGLGYAVEPVADRALTSGGRIYRVRDAALLIGGSIEPALETWLDGLGVRRLPAREAAISFARAGQTIIAHGEQRIVSETIILADDEAILAHLGEPDRLPLLRVVPQTSVVTEPAKPLAAPLIHFLDRDLTLSQYGRGGAISAIAAGQADAALPRIAASLSRQGRLRRSGQTLLEAVVTRDGAPLIGHLGKSRAVVVAGLGASAAFLAPILARVVTGTAAADEARYFAMRDASKAGGRQAVADLAVAESAA